MLKKVQLQCSSCGLFSIEVLTLSWHTDLPELQGYSTIVLTWNLVQDTMTWIKISAIFLGLPDQGPDFATRVLGPPGQQPMAKFEKSRIMSL